jgi:hypothetical protein
MCTSPSASGQMMASFCFYFALRNSNVGFPAIATGSPANDPHGLDVDHDGVACESLL